MTVFQGVLYQKTLQGFNDSPDGETATILYVTREANFWSVFIYSHEGFKLLHVEQYSQNKAIEFGVNYGRQPEAKL